MKKILIALSIVMLTASLFVTAASAVMVGVLDYSVSSTRVDMAADGTGSFTITTSGSTTPYAGVEFEVQLPNGAAIGSVSYSLADVAENPPATPPGGQKPDTVYFSCYALENKFTAALTCTVNVVYGGSVETNLIVKEIKQYRRIGEKADDPVHTTEDLVSDREARVALVPIGGGTPASTDATLSSLTVSAGALTPAFDPNITSYTSSVANGISGVTVTAVANHAGAKVAGAGVVSLSVGENKITVTVTAEDNVTKKEYVITMTRRTRSNSSVSGTEGEEVGDETTPLASLFPFTDVEESDWFYDDVYYMWENELMNGTSDALFSPGRTLTRGMVVTVLYRMEGEPDVSELDNPFPDVAAGQYYTEAVTWAAAEEIVLGYPGGRYGPDEDVTREQLAAIIHRYEGALGKTPENTVEARNFTDKDKISDYAQEGVNALVLQDIIRGRASGAFDPQGTATRAEFAAMLHRFLVAVKQ